jgi:hypothetical protein
VRPPVLLAIELRGPLYSAAYSAYPLGTLTQDSYSGSTLASVVGFRGPL